MAEHTPEPSGPPHLRVVAMPRDANAGGDDGKPRALEGGQRKR